MSLYLPETLNLGMMMSFEDASAMYSKHYKQRDRVFVSILNVAYFLMVVHADKNRRSSIFFKKRQDEKAAY